MALGLCDVSKESIKHLCADQRGGNAAIVIVGGAAESLDARPGSCTVTLKNRKGFIRMAITTGFVFIKNLSLQGCPLLLFLRIFPMQFLGSFFQCQILFVVEVNK